MTGDMWGALLGLLLFCLVLAVIIYAVWLLFRTAGSGTQRAREETYRHLAEQATEAQRRTADDIADLKERVTRIEKSLEQ